MYGNRGVSFGRLVLWSDGGGLSVVFKYFMKEFEYCYIVVLSMFKVDVSSVVFSYYEVKRFIKLAVGVIFVKYVVG